MKKYLIIACAILLLLSTALICVVAGLSEEKRRLKQNQDALMNDVEYYQTEAGKSAASVQRLELSRRELEQHNEDLTNTIESLNLKLKRVQAASSTATQTRVEIQTIVKDSIVYVESGKIEKLPAIKWRDPWIKVDGLISLDGEVNLTIESVDTLHQVVHRVPKKFWFIKYGTKAIRQEIVSSNPHTKIVYSEYIEMKGRKHK